MSTPSAALPPDDHLSRLYAQEVEEPWLKTFIQNIKEVFNPPKLPPLEVTSRPVAVKSIWGMYEPDKKNYLYGSAILGCVILVLGALMSVKTVRDAVKAQVTGLVDPVVLQPFKPAKQVAGGGGGGGDRSPTPVSKGKPPKISNKQFVPPMIPINPHPKLAIDPTIIAQVPPPTINSADIGAANALSNVLSNGIGSGGGMGSGRGGGLGSGDGAGWGPGHGGGSGGGVYRVGGGVSQPSILHQVDPEYSEEARKAKYSGVVLLRLVVKRDGHVSNVQVVRSLGLGLDEKAIEAVNKWLFKPGMKNGEPVDVYATVEVNFRLL